uniref:Predicted protein n=2 Tax=Hordeum vulgare subsp. vulgare TaxID=112509 RepID=F2D1Z9_HORVV|nr:predicted protein [Hordeum vulgare subsp. vulgare]
MIAPYPAPPATKNSHVRGSMPPPMMASSAVRATIVRPRPPRRIRTPGHGSTSHFADHCSLPLFVTTAGTALPTSGSAAACLALVALRRSRSGARWPLAVHCVGARSTRAPPPPRSPMCGCPVQPEQDAPAGGELRRMRSTSARIRVTAADEDRPWAHLL